MTNHSEAGSPYADLHRDDLERRLALAEDVCRMYAWSPARSKTDREKATYILWTRWLDAAEPTAVSPHLYPHLSDEEVAVLARERDDVRRRTRARLDPECTR